MVAKCLDLDNLWSCKYDKKKKTKKIDTYEYPVHDCIQGQNGSP